MADDNKVTPLFPEKGNIFLRPETASRIAFVCIAFGFMSAAVIFSHIGTQNHTRQSGKALTEQMVASEERITRRIEHEAGEMNRQYLAAQQSNLSNYQMSWAHMVKLTSTIERAGIEAPPMPEE